MEEHDHSLHEPARSLSFWQSRTGISLVVFLVIAAILLGYEHRVHIFGSSSGSFLFLFAWIGMHFFMHRGHGGHGNTSKPQASPISETTKNGGEKP